MTTRLWMLAGIAALAWGAVVMIATCLALWFTMFNPDVFPVSKEMIFPK